MQNSRLARWRSHCTCTLQPHLHFVHAPLHYDTCTRTGTCTLQLHLHLYSATALAFTLALAHRDCACTCTPQLRWVADWGNGEGKGLETTWDLRAIVECQRHLNHLFTSPLNLLVKTNRKDHSEMIRISFYLCNNDKFKDSEGYYKEKLMVAKNGHVNNVVEVYGREAPGPPRQTARHPRGSLFYGSPLIRARRTAAPGRRRSASSSRCPRTLSATFPALVQLH